MGRVEDWMVLGWHDCTSTYLTDFAAGIICNSFVSNFCTFYSFSVFWLSLAFFLLSSPIESVPTISFFSFLNFVLSFFTFLLPLLFSYLISPPLLFTSSPLLFFSSSLTPGCSSLLLQCTGRTTQIPEGRQVYLQQHGRQL